MAIIGINFTKMDSERGGNTTGQININNNVVLNDVKEIDVNLAKHPEKGLLVRFKYSCQYNPNVGKIIIEGDVVSIEPPEVIKRVVDVWAKDKKVDPEISKQVLSQVLNKCTVQAIVLSRDIGLPAPIPLPRIQEGAGKEGAPAPDASASKKADEKSDAKSTAKK
ncbi:MAG: hypothetical protein ACMXYE_00455 [Candidatus Woesearchaeota archaeon]